VIAMLVFLKIFKKFKCRVMFIQFSLKIHLMTQKLRDTIQRISIDLLFHKEQPKLFCILFILQWFH
jgi:hypothetical protein